MIEVEAKAKISELKSIREKARRIGKYIGKEKKIDYYYTLEDIKKYPQKSLRVRKRKGFYEVNFKQKLSYIKGVHVKDEKEFVVSKIEPFLDLIKDFGFKLWLKKYKISEIYMIEKNFHIELNYVKKLGWFLEVEYLCNIGKIAHARKRVLEVIDKLGIIQKDIIESGYTKMLWDKK